MTEHLPECWCAGRCPLYEGCECPCRDCICSALRDCEKRVLDTAREAVKAEFMQEGKLFNCYYECANEALAAIDALKGEK